MTAYYNEHDPYAAEWLRNLMAAGQIAPGVVDERSIEDVVANELAGYTQCHFFAGIGAWSYALRRAGWWDDRAVWTGSCPCQPFSAAGKGAGLADERHLWPAWFHLIRICRPGVVFGEQVASKDGRAWLDVVRPDMEAEDYAFAPAGLPACAVGSPHQRLRTYFMAYDTGLGWSGRHSGEAALEHGTVKRVGRCSSSSILADTECNGPDRAGEDAAEPGGDGAGGDGAECGISVGDGDSGELVNATGSGGQPAELRGQRRGSEFTGKDGGMGITHSSGELRRPRSEGSTERACEGEVGSEDGQRVRSVDQRTSADGELVYARSAGLSHCQPEIVQGTGRRAKRGTTSESGPTSGMGDTESGGLRERGDEAGAGSGGHADGAGDGDELGDTGELERGSGRERGPGDDEPQGVGSGHRDGIDTSGEDGGVEDAGGAVVDTGGACDGGPAGDGGEGAGVGVDGVRDYLEWVLCRDPRGPVWRPTEPGLFPLADGAPTRVDGDGSVRKVSRRGTLKGYGNAIHGELAAEFVECAMEVMR